MWSTAPSLPRPAVRDQVCEALWLHARAGIGAGGGGIGGGVAAAAAEAAAAASVWGRRWGQAAWFPPYTYRPRPVAQVSFAAGEAVAQTKNGTREASFAAPRTSRRPSLSPRWLLIRRRPHLRPCRLAIHSTLALRRRQPTPRLRSDQSRSTRHATSSSSRPSWGRSARRRQRRRKHGQR